MARPDWRHPRPSNLQEAIRACLTYAEKRHHRGVQRVADICSTSEWAIYGWMKEGSIPGKHIIGFEHACGCAFVSEYLAMAQHRMCIQIPTGRLVGPLTVNQLQQDVAVAIGHLLQFCQERSEANALAAIESLTDAMKDMGWHRADAERALQPELDLEGVEP